MFQEVRGTKDGGGEGWGSGKSETRDGEEVGEW